MKVSAQDKSTIKTLILQNKRLEAIEYARKAFSIDLSTAKKLIDHLDDNLEYSNPEFDQPLIGDQIKSNFKIPGLLVGCFSSVFIFVGLPFFGMAIYTIITQTDLGQNGVKVTGVVVSKPEQPQIEFEYDGNPYYHEAEVTSTPPSYSVGEEVELLINPENPNEAVINDFTERWLVLVIVSVIGFVFIGIGVGAWFFFRRNRLTGANPALT